MSLLPFVYPEFKYTEEIDFTQALKGYISTEYEQDWKSFKKQLEAINKLRIDATSLNNDILSRDVLYKYYHQLNYLELRFPINGEDLSVDFVWLDTITNEYIEQTNMAYEKANILYNLGCVMGSLGANKSKENDIKLAFNNFLAAAGVFNYIKDNFLHAPNYDLSNSSLNFYKNLMLAQAQECFVCKSMNDNKSPAIVAKLCSSLRDIYNYLLESFNNKDQSVYFIQYYKEVIEVI